MKWIMVAMIAVSTVYSNIEVTRHIPESINSFAIPIQYYITEAIFIWSSWLMAVWFAYLLARRSI